MRLIKYITKYLLVAIFIGIIIALYQLGVHQIGVIRNNIFTGSTTLLIEGIVLLLLIMVIIIYINKKNPGYYGSGIPQIEAYHNHNISFNPIKMLLLIITNSYYAFLTGFILGSEGPSISIATSIGMIFNKIFKDDDIELDAASGSAGFACAFMSPLAGLFHLIEENKKLFSIKLILKGIIIIAISFIVYYLINPHGILPYFESNYLPILFYIPLLVLIILGIIIAKLYIMLILKIKDLNNKYKFMNYLTIVLAIMFMIFIKYLPYLANAGSELLNIIDLNIFLLIGLLIYRIIFTSLSTNACVSGGIVLPTLAIGSILAGIVVSIFKSIWPDIINYQYIFIICGMMIVLMIVTKTPLTSFILGLKCMKPSIILLPLFIAIGLSYLAIYLLKWNNVYHELEKRIIPRKKGE